MNDVVLIAYQVRIGSIKYIIFMLKIITYKYIVYVCQGQY